MNGWRERAFAPARGTQLCALRDLVPDNGLEKRFGEGDRVFRLVLFLVADQVRAYVNECPHFRIPLNFREGTFCVYDIDGQRDLMCAHHTAMFHLADGFCYDGPCAGGRLVSVPIAIVGDRVHIA